ncbi:MAG: PIG-L family deacetylase [Actinomycetota bacterium]|nr:PIG-L family deacetylase [Actinomycetota bacterium]
MNPARALLSVSPHPDDELVGAPATLMALRDAGWRVVNLACSLGRPDDRQRRRAELVEACRLAAFELLIAEGIPPIGAEDDLALAQDGLSAAIVAALDDVGAEIIVGPSPHDGHHGHEVVGRAIRDAVEARVEPMHALFWGLWGDLPLPNVLVPFGAARLLEIQHALGAHAGELARNRLDRLVEGRAAANAVLGPERVFGFGAAGGEHDHAELLTDIGWTPSDGWRLTAPRELDPARPLAPAGGPAIGWWLHARSARMTLRSTVDQTTRQ